MLHRNPRQICVQLKGVRRKIRDLLEHAREYLAEEVFLEFGMKFRTNPILFFDKSVGALDVCGEPGGEFALKRLSTDGLRHRHHIDGGRIA